VFGRPLDAHTDRSFFEARMGAPGRDIPQMTRLDGKLSATTPEVNESAA